MSMARLKAHRMRSQKPATLNLVSLMDIFTILVFFLMVNTGNEVAQPGTAIKLPDSTARKHPQERIAILISADDVLVQGRKVASVKDIMASRQPMIAGLAAELAHQADRRRAHLANPASFEGSVTIMGDRNLPYMLLKRVMLTCQQADFTRIALAVNRITGKEHGA